LPGTIEVASRFRAMFASRFDFALVVVGDPHVIRAEAIAL
jgi:hypothetical protein